MGKKLRSWMLVGLLFTLFVFVSCATKKAENDEESQPQSKPQQQPQQPLPPPPPPPSQQPQTSSCSQKCDDEYEECNVECDKTRSDISATRVAVKTITMIAWPSANKALIYAWPTGSGGTIFKLLYSASLQLKKELCNEKT
jgi:hypothetical protein